MYKNRPPFVTYHTVRWLYAQDYGRENLADLVGKDSTVKIVLTLPLYELPGLPTGGYISDFELLESSDSLSKLSVFESSSMML